MNWLALQNTTLRYFLTRVFWVINNKAAHFIFIINIF